MVGFYVQAKNLNTHCLACHKSQQIPSQLMYKRYLMKYSSKKDVAGAMMQYLKDPKKSTSIMPAPFFLKFPMKEDLNLTHVELKQGINEFIEQFDLQKRLILKP